MSWNYAELSKLAKRAGGPEKLIKLVKETSKKAGRREMVPFIYLGFFLGVGVTTAYQKVVGVIKDSRCQADEAEKAAEIELIRGIREYDLEHPEQEEDKADVGVKDTETVEAKDQCTYLEEEELDGDGELAEKDSTDQGTRSEEGESDSVDEMTNKTKTKDQDIQTEEGE